MRESRPDSKTNYHVLSTSVVPVEAQWKAPRGQVACGLIYMWRLGGMTRWWEVGRHTGEHRKAALIHILRTNPHGFCPEENT